MLIQVRGHAVISCGRWVPGILVLFTLIQCGCGGPYQSAPVNVDKAHETLTLAMDSWKNGDQADSLQDQSPAIVVQDFDWIGGMKLLDYEIIDDGKPVDANLVANVKLKLQDKRGTKSEKTVTYHVGTAPALTVFRASAP